LSASDCHLFPERKHNPGGHEFKEGREMETVIDTMADKKRAGMLAATGNRKYRSTIR